MLPGPDGAYQLEHYLLPQARGVDSITLEVPVRLSGGTVYAYLYGRTAGNPYLGYRQSVKISTEGDTTATLRVNGVLTSEMDSFTVGVYHYGKGRVEVGLPAIRRSTLRGGAIAPPIADYLAAFFTAVRPQALDRETIDWEMLRTDAYTLAAGADSLPQVHPVLDFTLRRMHRHSSLQTPRAHRGWATGNNANDEVDPNLEYATGRRVDDRMVYLRMPGVSSGHDKTLRAYADSLARLIERLDAPGTDEWVLDLRFNTGGNCWAMLAGIGPLLGDGVCGYFMERDGSAASGWWYWEGGSWLGKQKQLTLTDLYVLRRPARIAVLYGPKTSSSGEVVAVAFRGLPNTRSFGQPTGGYSTGNRQIKLSDGANVLLTVSVYGDRDKNAYDAAIPPDELVEPIPGTDAAAEAAATWLRRGR